MTPTNDLNCASKYLNDVKRLFTTQKHIFIAGFSIALLVALIINILSNVVKSEFLQPGFTIGALTAISTVIVVAWISDKEGYKFNSDAAKKKVEKDLNNSGIHPVKI